MIVAGEISGDTHAAGLMREIIAQAPGTQFTGLGGPQMRKISGEGVEDWLDSAAVMGLSEVLAKYGYFKRRMADCEAAVAAETPAAVILVDYPGFNLRLAQRIRDQGIRTRIIYYISPQVWAWKKGRLKQMAKTLDLMICIFPFEKPLFEKSGLRTEFAGHPMMDRVLTLRRPWEREPGLVGWFPGSRVDEVRRLFPVMLAAARLIKTQVPEARFAVSAANEFLASTMRDLAESCGMPEARGWIETGTVYDLMQRAQAGVVASGTATLEAACFGLPYALIYKVAWPTYVVAKALVRIKFIGIINVLAGREVVRELIQQLCTPEKVAAAMVELLTSPEKRHALQEDLAGVVATLGDTGAYARAAQAALKVLEQGGNA
ncbi:MAG: lpxb: lipid-a-disaccharide synthase [Verrucomicrobiaceae bacterium]|nr:lpxb: lipid-a-disaccharide synthase [Verrucomicrobiaceae bacterium]